MVECHEIQNRIHGRQSNFFRISPRINHMKLDGHTWKQNLSPRARVAPVLFPLYFSISRCYKTHIGLVYIYTSGPNCTKTTNRPRLRVQTGYNIALTYYSPSPTRLKLALPRDLTNSTRIYQILTRRL
jgi:hypothetical protein